MLVNNHALMISIDGVRREGEFSGLVRVDVLAGTSSTMYLSPLRGIFRMRGHLVIYSWEKLWYVGNAADPGRYLSPNLSVLLSVSEGEIHFKNVRKAIGCLRSLVERDEDGMLKRVKLEESGEFTLPLPSPPQMSPNSS